MSFKLCQYFGMLALRFLRISGLGDDLATDQGLDVGGNPLTKPVNPSFRMLGRPTHTKYRVYHPCASLGDPKYHDLLVF